MDFGITEIIGIAGLAMSAIGTGVGFLGQMSAGQAAQRTASMQAKQMQLKAQAEKTQAAIDEQNRQMKLTKVLATQRAIFGSSGASLNSGSFLAIQNADTSEVARENRLGSLIADTNSSLYNMQADQYLAAGRERSKASLISGGVSLLEWGAKTLPRFAS